LLHIVLLLLRCLLKMLDHLFGEAKGLALRERDYSTTSIQKWIVILMEVYLFTHLLWILISDIIPSRLGDNLVLNLCVFKIWSDIFFLRPRYFILYCPGICNFVSVCSLAFYIFPLLTSIGTVLTCQNYDILLSFSVLSSTRSKQ
jgi:hypothetical protein